MNTVMVVDDDENIVRAVSMVLRLSGFEVRTAARGQDCLTQLREGFKGVVLMDIMMPGLTGWATIREVVAESLSEGVLFCMLTARTQPGVEGAELEEHIFDYLPKPFANKELIDMVKVAMSFLQP